MTAPTTLPLSARLRLRAAIFIAGACVMVLQVLGTRIIGPHYGVGLYVWTALIAVTLVALALGYWLGGKLADGHPSFLWFAAVLLLAAATVGLIPLLRGFVIEYGWSLGLRGGALLSAAVLFFPPLFLLGMISPYAIRLEAPGVEAAGRSAGRLYAISTAGSVFGAVLAGFYLVPHFRVPTLLALTAGLLALAAVLAASPGWPKRIILPAVVLAASGVFLAQPRPFPDGLVVARSFENSDLRVVDYKNQRFLMVDQAPQSALGANKRPLDLYAYFLASRVLLARPESKQALIVGLGGGSLVSLLGEQGIGLEAVELSPEVIDLARGYFGMNLPADKVHAEDGRVFLARHPGRYDVVILDAFSGDRLAMTLVSREGLQTAQAALRPGGLLVLNTWGIDTENGKPNRVGAAIRDTLRAVFPHVLAVPAAGNLLFFASDQPIAPQRDKIVLEAFDGPQEFAWYEVPPTEWPEGIVLTDDWNPADTLDAAGLERARIRRRADMPAEVRTALAWE
ncbi:MAG: fused MFS/spermidine synthase [Chthoniobacterales bacterium]|nr:fused MFS/spermidine synthase [Chthoniobacterales bacterium]